MIQLYDYPQSPYCQKVRIVLAEKDLSYEKIFVDLPKGGQKSPDFLRLNPYGRVPVLVDEDEVVYDSTIINEYLDDEYPHPPLMPMQSGGRARARMLEDFADNSFTIPTSLLLAELQKPEGEGNGERIQRYRAEVLRVLELLERRLEGKEYLAGGFSLADVAFVPRLLILPNHLGIEVPGRLKNILAWIERLGQRPSVRQLAEGLE
jgi:glutathione S-transferase